MKYLPLVIRNVFRNKRRSLFTGLSIAASLFLVVTLYSLITGQEELVDANSLSNRVAVLHEAGLAGSLPIAYVDRIKRVPGVMTAIPMSWFGGNYREERTTFPQFATDAKEVFTIYPELTIPPDQLAKWQGDKTGCVVGSLIANNKGWKVGSKIPLQGNIYPVDLELTVDGIYDGPESMDRTWVLFHFDYMDEALKADNFPRAGNAGIVMLRAKSKDQMPEVMKAITTAFASSDAPVKPLTEKAFAQSFMEMLGNVQGFINLTATAVVLALMCVAANTMAMSVRERTREIALLKAVGFSRWTVLGMYLAESAAIGLLGGILGGLGAKLLFGVVDLTQIDPGLAMFFVPWRTALWGLSLGATVGLLSGIIPAWRASQLSVVDGLRRIA
jgi:putative ABC transport system permease protein